MPGAIFALAVLASGCGPYVGTCAWLVPEADGEIKVSGPRRPIAGECNCFDCGAPGEFVLERLDYVIEFWNGDRWYPQLFLRVRAPDGQPLGIRSARLVENRPLTRRPDRYMEFDYFLDFVLVGGEVPPAGPQGLLEMEILSADGTILGEERVQLTLETRRDVKLEGV